MKFQIVYDQPGRIRVRGGAYAFTKEQEPGIIQYLSEPAFVQKAEVNCKNGSILINYTKGSRSAILARIRSMDARTLAIVPVESNPMEIENINRNFATQITKMIVKRYAIKFLMPTPIANLITTVRAIPYIWRGVKTLLSGKMKVEVLDAASIGACLQQRDFKTAGSIMFLLSISGLLEEYTRVRTKAVLAQSLAIKADKVWLVTEECDVLIPMNQLKKGDVIRIRTGNVIPIDGEIVDGNCAVGEASMTGEPLPVAKSAGDSVFAGTVVEEGSAAVQVRELASDSRVNQIVQLIENSEQKKSVTQANAERLADGIVPFSFLAFGLVWLFTGNATKAIATLMVDYSCAIKLSTPTAVISAIKEASDYGATVKGGKYFEALAEADTIIFDKTGTLTNAEPKLSKVMSFTDKSEDDILRIAACLEEHFPHSVATAIVKGAEERGLIHEEEHAEVDYIVAHGIATTLHGKRAVIGSRHFITEDEGVLLTPEQHERICSASGAASVVYLAVGGILQGVLCIEDPPRPEAKNVITQLRKQGFEHIVMLTGDSTGAAKNISAELGITEYHAGVLPEDKHKYVEDEIRKGHTVVMVGDGINDAPALAAASVSIAMGDATDLARETADITLRDAQLSQLPEIRRLSVMLTERIQKNYRFIVAFNTALLLSGVFGFLTPATSAFLHNASTMAICAKSITPMDKERKAREKKKNS